MTRLRKLTLCLTLTVWALLAPVAAGATLLDGPRLPAGWSWPEPVAGLQDLVRGWLAVLFGPSGVAEVEEGESVDCGTPETQITAPGGETSALLERRAQAHPDFDPNG